MISLNFLRGLIGFLSKPKPVYYLMWSPDFKAWQVYLWGEKRRFKYFKGWSITRDTNIDALNYHENRLGGKQYKQWI